MWMIDLSVFVLFISAGFLAALVLILYIQFMGSLHIYEAPNTRSSHKKPVLTGGGWPILLVALGIYWTVSPELGQSALLLCIISLGLALVSWLDDMSPLSATFRLGVHVIAVACMLSTIPGDKQIFTDLMPWQAERLIVGFVWLWFINAYNFMDGVDGMAATETVFICVGVFIVGYIIDLQESWILLATLLAGATFGFVYLNWYPAKIILGDVGSIPLGFLTGWLVMQIALKGYPIPAVILPIYFLADSSLTLAKRILNGEQFWKPHREHFYQKPVVAGRPHSDVVKLVILANTLILAGAVVAVSMPVLALFFALSTVAVLLYNLRQMS